MIVLIVSVLVSGCLFEHPISKVPTRKIDERLLGAWEGSDESQLKISRKDHTHYTIQIESRPGEVQTTIKLIGHHAAVAGQDVVWMRWIPGDETKEKGGRKWIPCAYEITAAGQLAISIPNGEKLPMLELLGRSIQKGTPEALAHYFQKAVPTDGFFHTMPSRYIRRPKQAEQGAGPKR
ncbi:MAG: hypothetical protein HKN82_00185 [Akkermansiaceae bacterium]|nr:hypothetical protein [Akkermansiaceae bacterium]